MTNAVTNKNPTPAVNQIFLLPLFYTFPAEVVAKSEFRDLPRNFHTALTDAQSLERIQSKQFLKDCTSVSAVLKFRGRSRNSLFATTSTGKV